MITIVIFTITSRYPTFFSDSRPSIGPVGSDNRLFSVFLSKLRQRNFGVLANIIMVTIEPSGRTSDVDEHSSPVRRTAAAAAGPTKKFFFSPPVVRAPPPHSPGGNPRAAVLLKRWQFPREAQGLITSRLCWGFDALKKGSWGSWEEQEREQSIGLLSNEHPGSRIIKHPNSVFFFHSGDTYSSIENVQNFLVYFKRIIESRCNSTMYSIVRYLILYFLFEEKAPFTGTGAYIKVEPV